MIILLLVSCGLVAGGAILVKSTQAKFILLMLLLLLAGTTLLLLIISLGAMASHYDSSSWPSPGLLALLFLLGYAVVAWASVRRGV